MDQEQPPIPPQKDSDPVPVADTDGLDVRDERPPVSVRSLPRGARLLYVMRLVGSYLWVTVKRFAYIVVRRGYVGVALGIYLVTKLLDRVIGSVPRMPYDMSDSLLVITVVISLFMYRQTLSAIRVRELTQRDRLRAMSLSPAASRAGIGPDTREAVHTHWLARKTMVWFTMANLVLMVYTFGIKMYTRQANLSGHTEPQVVVFPPEFLRPEAIRQDLASWINIGSTEPIDDSVTYNGGLYAYMLPNEYPGAVYAIVLPLNILFTIFCVMLTRACGFAFAPVFAPQENQQDAQQETRPQESTQAKSQVENKPGDVPRKQLPNGSDMGVEIADMIEDAMGFL